MRRATVSLQRAIAAIRGFQGLRTSFAEQVRVTSVWSGFPVASKILQNLTDYSPEVTSERDWFDDIAITEDCDVFFKAPTRTLILSGALQRFIA